jgi:hypothetical protein
MTAAAFDAFGIDAIQEDFRFPRLNVERGLIRDHHPIHAMHYSVTTGKHRNTSVRSITPFIDIQNPAVFLK